MDLDSGVASTSFASTEGEVAKDVAADQMEMEAAEILAAFSHLKKRGSYAVAAEFAAKWGCKRKRERRRVSSSESPPSDTGLNPVQSGSDLAEQDTAMVEHQEIESTSTTEVVEPVEAEHNAKLLTVSHTFTTRYTSNGVLRSRQNVTEAKKEPCTLHKMLTKEESDWPMIHERQILFSLMGMPEKDIWEDRQQDKTIGNVLLLKQVKAEQNAESVKSSATCAMKYMSGGRGRSRQNLTEAEKEAKRLRRILANRESARQTIRRRQALCEKLTVKVADLTRENENLKRAKELALKEYQSQENANKQLKAQMTKAIKAEEGEALAELKSAHQISGPSGNYPFFLYNQHPFPPFCWPSIIQSSHPVQSQCGLQNGIAVPSSISSSANGRLDSSHDQETPMTVDGLKTPVYMVPYPWFFSLPDHANGLHSQPSCGPKNIKDETSINNPFSAGCSLESAVYEEKIFLLPKEDEKEDHSSIEASSNNQNYTPVSLPPDGGGRIKEEVRVSTSLCTQAATFVVEPDKTPDYVVNSECIKACHFVGALPEENQESTNYASKKVQDIAAAAEARKRRKELTKLKNLHSRQCRIQR